METWKKTVTRESDPELWYGLLGGSPGNFGVISHVELLVHREEPYKNCEGLWSIHIYSSELLLKFLDKLAEFSDNDDLPRGLDICISVVSEFCKPYAMFDDLFERLKQAFMDHDKIGPENPLQFRAIIVYVQWVPFPHAAELSAEDYSKYFLPFKGVLMDRDTYQWKHSEWNRLLPSKARKTPPTMSELTSWWIFPHEREFDFPYVKRTYLTNNKHLSDTPKNETRWALKVTERINQAIVPPDNGLYLSCQIQALGGKNSQFASKTEKDTGTSFSWRDSTIIQTLDAFHRRDSKQSALNWQAENDAHFAMPGTFTDRDRRVLWGSYTKFHKTQEEYIMDNVKHAYYDRDEKYERLKRARRKYDPDGIYTPNTFCVPRAPTEEEEAVDLGQRLIHHSGSWLPFHPKKATMSLSYKAQATQSPQIAGVQALHKQTTSQPNGVPNWGGNPPQPIKPSQSNAGIELSTNKTILDIKPQGEVATSVNAGGQGDEEGTTGKTNAAAQPVAAAG